MVKKYIKKIVYDNLLSCNFILPVAKSIRAIFVLHDVSNSEDKTYTPYYSTTPQKFKQTIEYIHSNFNIISLDAIHQQELPTLSHKHYAAIVFDDGFKSVYTTVNPFLQKNKIPFSIFVNKQAVTENWLWFSHVYYAQQENNQEYLSKIFENYIPSNTINYEQFIRNPVTYLNNSNLLTDDYVLFQDEKYKKIETYMNEDEIMQLHNKGVVIGNHTLSHKQLSSCIESIVAQEIVENKKYIEFLTQKECKHFAIPFGFMTTYNQQVLKIAEENHSYIYSTKRSFFKISDILQTIPRIALIDETKGKIMSYINFPFIRKVKM
ncbi:MAG TPA: polysaccharide deacetylase family protein [Bacteroidia bacterium]|nr:polysaccharide deacetylase family protein [Bacteroidia bacterium]